jgi:hypothetical protein
MTRKTEGLFPDGQRRRGAAGQGRCAVADLARHGHTPA